MSTKIKWSKSISTNLLKWFLLLSLTPIVIISFLVYKDSSDTLYKSVSSELDHSSSSYIHFIQNWFNYRQTDIKTWSSNKNTIEFMDALDETFSASKKSTKEYVKSPLYVLLTEAYENDFIELSREYDYIYDIFLISVKGDILFTVSKENDLGTNLLNGEYASTRFAKSFAASLQDGRIHFQT